MLSDMSGMSGLRMLHAIVEGERDLQALAGLCDWRIKATKAEVVSSLQGNWRDELIFVVEENLAMYGEYQQKIRRCDSALSNI